MMIQVKQLPSKARRFASRRGIFAALVLSDDMPTPPRGLIALSTHLALIEDNKVTFEIDDPAAFASALDAAGLDASYVERYYWYRLNKTNPPLAEVRIELYVCGYELAWSKHHQVSRGELGGTYSCAASYRQGRGEWTACTHDYAEQVLGYRIPGPAPAQVAAASR